MAGLSAAIRLRLAGYQVEIFEKEAMPGGKMHQIRMDGHVFDVGPTLVMMPAVYRDLFRLAGRDPEDYIPMTRLEPMYDVVFKGSPPRKYSIGSDLVSLMEIAEAKGPRNSAGFLSYLAEIYKRYQVAMASFITRPFRGPGDIYTPHMLRQTMKLKTFDSASNMMASFMPDEDLQRMFSFQTLYIGVSPHKGPSLYNIIPMIELLYGVWFIKGGMHTMAQQTARLFEELGGRIHYKAEVDHILIREGRVAGLSVQGEEHAAPYVVCNADFPYAITQLVQSPAARGKYTPEYVDKMDYACSCLIFYWGVTGSLEDMPAHTFIMSEDLDENLRCIFDGSPIPDPSIYLHIPSRVDPDMAPPGCSSLYVLLPVSELGVSKYAWDEERVGDYRAKALAALATLPGMAGFSAEQIRCEAVFTPRDFEERFHAYRGSCFGLQPTLRQSNHWRPQPKSMHCEGLYFTGSSIHPGAGVPIVIESGRLCAEELRRDEPEDPFK